MLDKWLKTISLCLAVLLLCLLCLVAWQLLEIGQSVLKISSNVSRVASSVADVSTQVRYLGDRIEVIRSVVASLSDPKEIADKVSTATHAIADKAVAGPPMDERAEEEISHLLLCIGDQKYRYEYGEKSRTAEWVHLKISGKYALFRSSISSAEDFIDKVASETHEGDTYYIISGQGEKKPLGPWLREMLTQYRAQGAPSEAAP